MRRQLRSRDRENKEELGVYSSGRMRRSLRTSTKSNKTEEKNQEAGRSTGESIRNCFCLNNWRAVMSPAKALIPAIRPLLDATLQTILHAVRRVKEQPNHIIAPCGSLFAAVACGTSDEDLMFSEEEDCEVSSSGLTSQSQLQIPAASGLLNLNGSVLSQPTSYRPRLLLEGRPGSGQSSHLAPAVLHALEKFPVYTLDMAVLFGASATAPEETCAKVQELFRVEYGEVFHVPLPTSQERRDFFEDLIINQAAKAPASKRKAVLRALEVLPVAPPPQPRQLTEEESRRLDEQEEDTLRELRLFLRDVTNRLSQDKRFKAFTKPVGLEE
ncbi:hypothetical protein XENOCAPTIV_004959, partial [Xenoophorus captivus]